MPYYRSVGHVPQKRHTQHRAADGTLYFEELMGEEGLLLRLLIALPPQHPFGHQRVPGVGAARPVHPRQPSAGADPPLHTHKLFDESVTGIDAVTGRRLLLGNSDVRLSYVVADSDSPYYRNAIGDECLFLEAGEAVIETVFGDLRVSEGDYAIIPRATTHRIVPMGSVRIYAIEANSHITPPKRYLSRFGQLLEHALTWEEITDRNAPVRARIAAGSMTVSTMLILMAVG